MMARPGATNVKTAASGEIDDQLFIGRTLYGFGLGQGIMDLCKRSQVQGSVVQGCLFSLTLHVGQPARRMAG
jgi:hypothetical protein